MVVKDNNHFSVFINDDQYAAVQMQKAGIYCFLPLQISIALIIMIILFVLLFYWNKSIDQAGIDYLIIL